MVFFINFFQPVKDPDRILNGGRFHKHGLKTAFQCGILLNAFAVFIQRGGTDALQFAAGQSGLDDIGGIHGAFRPASAHDRMQFVDEQDHLF